MSAPRLPALLDPQPHLDRLVGRLNEYAFSSLSSHCFLPSYLLLSPCVLTTFLLTTPSLSF